MVPKLPLSVLGQFSHGGSLLLSWQHIPDIYTKDMYHSEDLFTLIQYQYKS